MYEDKTLDFLLSNSRGNVLHYCWSSISAPLLKEAILRGFEVCALQYKECKDVTSVGDGWGNGFSSGRPDADGGGTGTINGLGFGYGIALGFGMGDINLISPCFLYLDDLWSRHYLREGSYFYEESNSPLVLPNLYYFISEERVPLDKGC